MSAHHSTSCRRFVAFSRLRFDGFGSNASRSRRVAGKHRTDYAVQRAAGLPRGSQLGQSMGESYGALYSQAFGYDAFLRRSRSLASPTVIAPRRAL